VSNKTNTNFFKQENEECILDQRQSSNNSAKNNFPFKKPNKKGVDPNKKKKNKEKNASGKKQTRLKKINVIYFFRLRKKNT
jgi:hypothetical protein